MVYENTMNNKRKSFNQDNDNYQGGGKFKKSQDFGNRAPFKGNQNNSPFNKGNGGRDNSFNQRNRGGYNSFNQRNRGGNNSFNQRNRGGNNSFNRNNNRGDNNSSNKGYNNRGNFGGQRKSWQNDNDHNNKSFKENDSLEIKNNSDKSFNEDDTLENKSINENSKDETNEVNADITNDMEESDSSESEEEIVLKDNIVSQNDSETSESEKGVVIEKMNKSDMNEADSSESSSAEEEYEIIKGACNENKSEIDNGNDDNSEASESEEEIDVNVMEVSQIQDSPSKINSNVANDFLLHKELSEWHDRAIVVKYVTKSINSNHLEAFFSRYGKIECVKKSRTPLKFFICYEKPDDALKALEVNGMKYMEYNIVVRMWGETGSLHEGDFTNAVYIRNIGDDMVNASSLREKFNHCGIIKNVFYSKLENCAVLWFDSEDAVELALAMDKTLLGDRLIYVQTVDAEKIKQIWKNKSTGFKHHKHSFKKSPRFQTGPVQNRYMGRSPRPGFINKRY